MESNITFINKRATITSSKLSIKHAAKNDSGTYNLYVVSDKETDKPAVINLLIYPKSGKV